MAVECDCAKNPLTLSGLGPSNVKYRTLKRKNDRGEFKNKKKSLFTHAYKCIDFVPKNKNPHASKSELFFIILNP